jgi:hypothetical protein
MNLPVAFTHQEKEFLGELQPVHGAGASVYHLMIDGYYYGRLRQANEKWVLDTNKKSVGMEVIAKDLAKFTRK